MAKIGLIPNVGKVYKSIKLPQYELIRYRNYARYDSLIINWRPKAAL